MDYAPQWYIGFVSWPCHEHIESLLGPFDSEDDAFAFKDTNDHDHILGAPEQYSDSEVEDTYKMIVSPEQF